MFAESGDLVTLGIWLSVISLAMIVAGAIVVPWLAVRMPADYLVRRTARLTGPPPNPVAYWTLLVLRNLCGGALVLAGIVMLGVPGPGWGAILVGLALMSFPGKRRIQRKLLSSQFVVRPLNAIRARACKPPLEVPSQAEQPPQI
jgi:hypothetical protein